MTNTCLNVFYQELKPIFLVLKLTGIMPYKVSPQGELVFKVLSLEVAYAVILQSSVLALTIFALETNDGEETMQNGSFGSGVYYLASLLFQFTIVAIIPLHWLEIRGQIYFINMWMTFQEDFRLVSGQVLSIAIRRQVLFAIGVATSFCISVVGISIWRGCMHEECSFVSITTRCYICTVIILIPALWNNSCRALTQSAKRLAVVIKQSSSPSRYISLWFRLNAIAKEMGTCQGWTAGLITLIFFSLQVLLSYTFVIGYRTELSSYAGILSIVFGLLVYDICNLGEKTNLEISENIKEQLFDIEDQIHPSNRQPIREIHKFIAIIHRNAIKISFSNFAVVGRSLYAAFSSALVTYIIVLAQFGMSAIPEVRNNTQSRNVSLENETTALIVQ